jgi:peptidoglycan/LPS O-acetylase OafA/YrhL
LFFFLSGWLLISIYGINDLDLKKSYWIRRTARIMPLWILFLGVQIIAARFSESGGWAMARKQVQDEPSIIHSPIGILILTITFTLWVFPSLWNTVIPGGWSIQAEVGHYIIFPILRKYGLRKTLTWMICINFLTISLVYLQRHVSGTHMPKYCIDAINAWVRLDLFATFGYFLIGIISFIGYRQFRKIGELRAVFGEFRISKISFFLLGISFLLVPLNFGSQPVAIISMLFMIAISLGIYQILSLRKLFSFFGKYSYFIYFCHFQVLSIFSYAVKRAQFTLSIPLAQPLIFLCLICTTLFISSITAVVSFKYFENPILKRAHLIK